MRRVIAKIPINIITPSNHIICLIPSDSFKIVYVFNYVFYDTITILLLFTRVINYEEVRKCSSVGSEHR